MTEPDAPERPPRAPTALVRIGGAGRTPGLIAAVVAVFVAVALIKPWPPAAPRPTAAPGTPPPTQQPSIDALAAIREDCQDPPSWRLYSRERWPGGTLRSWRTLDPVDAASGPLDPVIPVLPITPDVLALGYCAPWESPERPPDDAAVHVWMLVAGRPPAGSVVPVALAVRSASPTLEPPLGALIAPPAAIPGSAPGAGSAAGPGAVGATGVPGDAWPAGTYVFAVEGTEFARWWSVRIPELVPAAPSGSPVR